MADAQDRVRRDESPLQKLLGHVPGFTGYREREVRRRADQVLREHLVALLDDEKGKLQRCEADLSRAGKLTEVGVVDRVLGQLQKVRDKVRYADYGYSGFFDTPNLRPGDLDKLYAHDLSLRDSIQGLDKKIEAVASADSATVGAAAEALAADLRALEALVDQRGDVMTGLAQPEPEQGQ